MSGFEKYRLRPMVTADTDMVLQWRNSDRVRPFMYSDAIISDDEHKAWFDATLRDPSCKYLICEYEQAPIGQTSFTEIKEKQGTCMWGFYIGETKAPRGSGTIMGYLSMNYILDQVKLNQVAGQVLEFNKQSQRLFRRLGFREGKRLHGHAEKNGQKIDALTFFLSARDWRTKCRANAEKIIGS